MHVTTIRFTLLSCFLSPSFFPAIPTLCFIKLLPLFFPFCSYRRLFTFNIGHALMQYTPKYLHTRLKHLLLIYRGIIPICSVQHKAINEFRSRSDEVHSFVKYTCSGLVLLAKYSYWQEESMNWNPTSVDGCCRNPVNLRQMKP